MFKTVSPTSLERWWPIEPPVTSTPARRSAVILDSVLDALHVEENPRYRPGAGNTYCNIFTWDVTRCMGVEIPHWVDAHEQTANDMIEWLDVVGWSQGWRVYGPRDAQAAANAGLPVVVGWHSPPGKIGHVAVCTPADTSGAWLGASICNVGARVFRRGRVTDGFGARDVRYWGHA